MTSRADDVTSVRARWRRWMRPLLTQSTATSRTSDHRTILARYLSSHSGTPSQQRTVDDRRDRRRCPVDISFLRRRWLRRVDCMCPRYTDGLWRTKHRQHTWCCLAQSLQSRCLHHTTRHHTLLRNILIIRRLRARYTPNGQQRGQVHWLLRDHVRILVLYLYRHIMATKIITI